MAIPARECEAARSKSPHYLGRGPGVQKALEEQCDAFLHLTIWVLGDDTGRIADEASRKLQCQLAAFRFGQQARRQPPANGVQFELRDRTFQAKQEAAVRCPRIVDAVAIGDQTAAMTAYVEQWIPIRAVARQPRDLDLQEEAEFFQWDARDQIFEPLPMRRGCTAQTEIGIDHIDVGLMPPEFASTLAQCILQSQALLIVDHLLRRRLTNIHHRFAIEMVRLDEFRFHGSPPARPRRDRRRSHGGLRPADCARRPEARWACALASFGRWIDPRWPTGSATLPGTCVRCRSGCCHALPAPYFLTHYFSIHLAALTPFDELAAHISAE